ncbi:YceI family protein [Coraliomargarita parva]|uniref:YceI family protein n=1 Tax=Coraliomargarita parva TaxID=3014050 RepID=UPI0022B42812|nr:YceI family protein [Coraliomargarita parva]
MKHILTTIILAGFACLPLGAGLQAAEKIETYKIDPVHSSVKFSIRHFVAKTSGSFGQFEGTITVNRDDLTKSSVEAVIQVASVDTANEKRDAHLKTDDFFGAESHPIISFRSTKWEATDDEDEFEVTGELRMHGMTKEVTLEVELLGFGEGMQGAYLSGWEVTTEIDRTGWGITGGQPAVGDEVEITINIEAIRQ